MLATCAAGDPHSYWLQSDLERIEAQISEAKAELLNSDRALPLFVSQWRQEGLCQNWLGNRRKRHNLDGNCFGLRFGFDPHSAL